MTRDTIAILVYFAAVLVATTFHHLAVLGIVFSIAAVIAGRDFLRVAGRALRAIVVFNSVVTVSYAVASSAKGNFALQYLLLVNARVFVLTFLTFLTSRRINILRAASFSRTLCYVITLALGQIVTFRRMLSDFRMAMTSRTVDRVRMKHLYFHAASSSSFFFQKALSDAGEITDGMKSRGVFDD